MRRQIQWYLSFCMDFCMKCAIMLWKTARRDSMRRDSYGIVRLAERYERAFQNRFETIREEKSFHIEQLKGIIGQAKNALNMETDNIEMWAGTMQVVYEVDDANTLIEKIQLFFMKLYVNHMYDKALRETRCIQLGIEKLQKLLNRLLLLDAFR